MTAAARPKQNKLRVCIDARLIEGESGGLEQVIVGLACGLSLLDSENEEYVFATYRGKDQWLRPHVSGPCRIFPVASATVLSETVSVIALAAYRLLLAFGYGTHRAIPALLIGDSLLSEMRVDVMHFTRQKAFLTRIPSLYHPHDLQHRHFPEFFSRTARAIRELRFQAFISQASLIPVASSWVRDDVINAYSIAAEKVQVVPLAPPLEAYPVPGARDMSQTRTRYALPAQFIFYAAQTWPHKNHVALLEALAAVRDRDGMLIPLICSGALNAYFPVIDEVRRRLGLERQVQFIGFVSPLELQCLYKMARAVVVPTKFEAGSFPVFEAFLAKTPVACSAVTSLPEQAGSAALFFNPDDPDSIARAITRLWSDAPLRQELIDAGTRRVAQFTWGKTAKLFRAHYRRVAKRALSVEDHELLSAAPTL